MLNMQHISRHNAAGSRATGSTCHTIAQRPRVAGRKNQQPVLARSSNGNGQQEAAALLPVESPAAVTAAVQQAYQAGSLAFGFSAGGLLFPYYLGVADQLQALGIMQPHSQLAGASAGSLIVACIKSGLPLTTIQAACFELARDCRRNGTRHRLKLVLESVLREVLPADVAQKCSGQVHVAVTRITPRLQPKLVTRFRDRDDLIQALLTSCHIPWYFDGSLITTFRKTPCFDGGITNFLPDVPGAGHTCRVCCLPSKQLARIGNIAISPDTYVKQWPFSLQQMLGWAFEPAEEQELLMLIECGKRDALAWAKQHDLVQLAANSRSSNGSSSSGNGKGATSSVVLPGGAASNDNLKQQQQQGQAAPVGRSLVLGLLGNIGQRK